MAAVNGDVAAHANGNHTLSRPSTSAGGDAAALQLLQEFLQVQGQRAEVYSRFNAGFREFLEHGQEAALARLMQQVTPAFSAASQQVIHIEAALKSGPVGRPDLAALLRGVQEAERSKLQLTLSWQALRSAHASGRFSWQEAADRPRATGRQAQHTHAEQQHAQLLAVLEQVRLDAAAVGAQQQQQQQQQQRDTAGRDQGHLEHGNMATLKPGFYAEQMQRAAAAAAAAGAGSSTGAAGCDGQAAAGPHHGCQHGHEHGDDPLEPTEAEYTAAVREALQELDACVLGINETLEEVREAIADLQ